MRKIVLLNCLVVLLSTSCTSRIYYQVFETETSTEKIEKQSNALVYEDEKGWMVGSIKNFSILSAPAQYRR